jgi:prepilin-type N-terminal cleavage/methylation domain-containing protein
MLARIRKAREEREGGFTLIELLVVIIIIGILAAIAIPVFLNQRKKGYDAQVKADLRNAATGQETYLTDNNVYTTSQTALTSTAVGWKPSTADTFVMAISAGLGYCMVGNNPNSPTNFWLYDSNNGGLQSAPYATQADAKADCKVSNLGTLSAWA